MQKDTNEYLSIFFTKPKDFTFLPGGCFDLAFTEKDFHEGRIFSFSSSPTEKLLRVTFKKGITEYKKRLEQVKKGDLLDIYYYGTQYTFHPDRLMVFYAGGIGIAVFRSIIKQLVDMRTSASITLIYSNSTEKFPFRKELDTWKKSLHLSIFYLATQKEGRLTKEKLISYLDFMDTEYEHYVIGPPSMVDDTREILRTLQVDPKTVHTDSFDGYNEEV